MKFLIAASLFLLPLQSFASKTAEAVFKKFSGNIVQIESVYGTGTGFFVSDELILTNRHVVFGLREGKKNWNAPRHFILPGGHKVSTYEFMICSKRIDICALRIEGGKGTEKISFPAREIVPGEDVFVIGHPKKINTPVISSGVVSSKVSTLMTKDYENKIVHYQGFTTNASISYGSSGSPVLSKNGELLGVITSFMKASQNLNIAVSSVELHRFLTDLNDQKFDDYLVMDPGYEQGLDKKIEVVTVIPETKHDTIEFRKVLSSHVRHLKACYQAELDRSEQKFRGTLNLNFNVGTNGSVVATKITTQKGYLTPGTIECVSYVIRKIKFPASNSGIVEVNQSMNFFPK